MTTPHRKVTPTNVLWGIIGLLWFLGCGTATTGTSIGSPATSRPVTTPSVPYTVNLTASIDGTNVIIAGTTNLPDNTAISLSANRPIKNEGKDSVRASPAASGDAKVSAGAFKASLPIDEKALTLVIGDPTDPKMVAIDQRLAACATVSTAPDAISKQPVQPPEVSAVIGPMGEAFANSPQMKVFGELTKTPSKRLEVMTYVDYPSTQIGEITKLQGVAPTPTQLEGFCTN